MKLYADDGRVLDAEFDLEIEDDHFVLTLHARGGGKQSGRNTDYYSALETILQRTGRVGGQVLAVTVDSKVALELEAAQRVVSLPYPISVTPATNPHELRLLICNGQRTVASGLQPGQKGGNTHKKIRITMDVNVEGLDDLVTLLRIATPVPSARTSARIGVDYRHATPDVRVATSDPFAPDASKLEKALKAHAEVQNQLAAMVATSGLVPRSPGQFDPDFDLLWFDHDGDAVVAEVKSMTESPVQQLRGGLGQLIQYRFRLSRRHERVRAVLAVDIDPESDWVEICASAGVTLTWPPAWPGLFSDR